MSQHSIRFPHESADYRATRDRLLEAETALRDQVQAVAELRRSLPPGGRLREDYTFDEMRNGQVETVRFSQLFDPERDSLIVYSFMFGPDMEKPCPMCSSLIDGFDATVPRLRERANLVVVAKSPIERITHFARHRGWRNVRLLSSNRNTYNRDYFGEDEEGDQWPMANVFVRRTGGIEHFWASELLFVPTEGDPCHLDQVWPLWNLLDLTPEGRGSDWYPSLD